MNRLNKETVLIVKQFPDVDLVAARKCGSATIAHMRPDVPFIEEAADVYIPRKPVVLVLRNPQTRLRASARSVKDGEDASWYCAPYLHHFIDRPLRYIPFIHLHKYVEERHGGEMGIMYPPVPEDYPVQPQDLLEEIKNYGIIIGRNDQLPVQDITKW